MSQNLTRPIKTSTLRDLLAQRVVAPDEALSILRQLAARVRRLHQLGQSHRAIRPETVLFDERHSVTLADPESNCAFGGASSDRESCPPELQGKPLLQVPSDIETVRQELARAGIGMDPRRIDVYQLGALCCSLTGTSVTAYLRDPKAKARIVPWFQPVIERALGYNAEERYSSCEELAAALESLATASRSKAAVETPVDGSRLAVSDTPVNPSELPVTALTVERKCPVPSLPFDRLGPYRIDRQLGRGGMGIVYLGYEEALDRPVAVKVLPAELARNESLIRRFRTEAAAVAKLTHPNVVPIYSIGTDAGHHYFAMQYVEGESLDRLLARRGRLGADETLAILEQCLIGLGAVHETGLVHRDVKPGNILIEEQSRRVLVADFGLVKNTEGTGITATGVVVGTLDYLAPEQARGQKADQRSDLYSLGVLAYQMLSGRIPFEAETPSAMMYQHAYEAPRPLQSMAPDVPAPLVALVEKLMAKEPGERYQSCAEVLAAIQSLRTSKSAPPARKSEGRVEAAPRPSQIVRVPALEPAPVAPSAWETAAPTGWWQRTVQRFGDLFRRHAPEVVQHLQTTGQQVDGAVAEYQRRRDRLAGLLDEAKGVTKELAIQARSYREAAADAARRADAVAEADCAGCAADLEAQIAEQEEQIVVLEQQFAQADATLLRLRNQRDVLNARLRVAEARLRMQGGQVPRARRRFAVPVLLGAVGLGVLLLVVSLLFRGRPAPPESNPSNAAVVDLSPKKNSRADVSSADVISAKAKTKRSDAAQPLDNQAPSAAVASVPIEKKPAPGANSVNSTTIGPSSPLPPSDNDREMAEWAIRLGGTVGIFIEGGAHPYVKQAEQLPMSPFRLDYIYFAHNPKLTDADFEPIEKCVNLRQLRFINMPITAAALAHFRALQKLEELYLEGTHVSGGLEHLKGLRKLNRLWLRGTPLSDRDLKELEGFPSLVGIDLSSTRVTDKGLESLRNLSTLQFLHLLHATEVTGTGLVYLKDLPNFNTLGMYGSRLNDGGLEQIGKLKHLRTLEITSTRITDAGLEHIKTLEKLTSLRIGFNSVTDEGVAHLAELKQLVTLSLDNTRITDLALAHFKCFRNLAHLDVSRTWITDAGLEHLKQLKSMDTLNLAETKITNEGLKHLGAMTSLRQLILMKTQVSDAGLEHLKGLKNLSFLLINETNITPEGAKRLRMELPRCNVSGK